MKYNFNPSSTYYVRVKAYYIHNTFTPNKEISEIQVKLGESMNYIRMT